MVHYLISLQQIAKVLGFTSFYCFCYLPSLHFLQVLKGKRFFSPILGLHFLIVTIFDGLLMNVFHSE